MYSSEPPARLDAIYVTNNMEATTRWKIKGFLKLNLTTGQKSKGSLMLNIYGECFMFKQESSFEVKQCKSKIWASVFYKFLPLA